VAPGGRLGYQNGGRFSRVAEPGKSPEPLPQGKVQLKVLFTYEGKGDEVGKGATVAILVNGARVAEGRLPKTIPIQISLGEGMDVGMDTGSAVDFNYQLPFKFTGKIDHVTIELK
jgi:arylsulfatase